MNFSNHQTSVPKKNSLRFNNNHHHKKMSSNVQLQDLSFFKDGNILPSSYLLSSSQPLSLITSIEGVNPSWLINTLIESIIYDSCSLNRGLRKNDELKLSHKTRGIPIIIISFINDFNYFKKNLIKFGIDLDKLNGKIIIIDCLTNLFMKIDNDGIRGNGIQNNYKPGPFQDIDDLFKQLYTIISKLTPTSSNSNNNKPAIILEAPDILLSSNLFNSKQLLKLMFSLQKVSSSLYVSLNIDEELIDIDKHPEQTSIEFQQYDFLVHMIHRASLIIGLKPLETGRAKDVTGILRISRGTVPLSIDENDEKINEIQEREYFYLVNGDAQVQLFFR